MLKRMFLSLLLVLPLVSLSGCIYSKVTTPYDTDVNNTELGDKVGRASMYSVLWLVAWGDAGVDAAAKNGNIKVVKHLDRESNAVLFGLYSKITTIAYGE